MLATPLAEWQTTGRNNMDEGNTRASRVPLSYQHRMQIEFQAIDIGPRKAVTYALCLLLGMFGAHRFYLADRKAGRIMLFIGITIIGLPVTLLWAITDLFRIPGMIRARNAAIREQLTAEAIAEAEA